MPPLDGAVMEGPSARGGTLGLVRGGVPALGDAAAEDLALVAEPLDGQAQFEPQLVQIGAAEVAQFDVLEIVPDALVRIQVRGVAGQLLQLEARRGSLRQEVLDGPGAMDRRPIPDHEQLARNLAEEMLQKLDDLGAPKRALADLEQEPPLVGQAADDREMIAGTGHPEDRRLPPRGVGAHQARQQIEAGLVYPDNRTPLALGFAKRAGQRSVHHWVMAVSLRWVARRIGFCTLQPISRRSRLICAGWYRTPNSCLIREATRLVVHTSPKNPCAAAPCSSRRTNSAFCSALSRDTRPGGIRWTSAWAPPSRARLSHWLTAPGVTPSACAIARPLQPAWCKAQARSRRHSV